MDLRHVGASSLSDTGRDLVICFGQQCGSSDHLRSQRLCALSFSPGTFLPFWGQTQDRLWRTRGHRRPGKESCPVATNAWLSPAEMSLARPKSAEPQSRPADSPRNYCKPVRCGHGFLCIYCLNADICSTGMQVPTHSEGSSDDSKGGSPYNLTLESAGARDPLNNWSYPG